MNTLNPCPFCGSSDLSMIRDKLPPSNRKPYKASFYFYVKCHTCGTQSGNYAGQNNQENAKQAWNKRYAFVEETTSRD